MKTATKFFSLMIAVLIVGVAGHAGAQGRGHNKEHKNTPRHHDNDHWKHGRKNDVHDYRRDHVYHERHRPHNHGHGMRQPSHRHDHYCGHRVVIVHQRPRYIHYRDYDVYYDTHREVYISYSGRNWTVSASIPIAMRHADPRHVVLMEVDYYHDDLVRYLETERPSYRRIFTGS